MRCHYVTDTKTGTKVLIPGCMSVAVYNDMDVCCCRESDKSSVEALELRVRKLEKKMNMYEKDNI